MFKKIKTKIHNWYYDIIPEVPEVPKEKPKTIWYIPKGKEVECYNLWHKYEQSSDSHMKRINRFNFWEFAYDAIPELRKVEHSITFKDGATSGGVPYFEKTKD